MTVPSRLAPLLAEYNWSSERLLRRIAGPGGDSGDGETIEIPRMTDDEYLWEPVPRSWSVRRKADGPGHGATMLVGAGDWDVTAAARIRIPRPSRPSPGD